MEYFFAILFLLTYYLRPQDWVPGMAGVQIVQPLVGLWLVSLVLGRSRPSALTGVFRTPHDTIMVAYLGYIFLFADGGLSGLLSLLAFYTLTVQSITSWDRLRKYLVFWNGTLAVLAALGVLSTFGFDPTGAQENQFTKMDRLALGTWLHNNPNALAHSIVLVIPGAYLLHFWKGTPLGRALVFPLMAAVAFQCAWLTQSKGGYVVGGALVVVALILGKPRWLQATAVAAALTVGISALSFLPRMSEMNNLRADEGVQGRLLAWELAKTAERQNHTGVGWDKFIAMVPWKERNVTVMVPKATHSSYVQIAADLGRYGLFFYLAGLWCAFRTLLVFRASTTDQERCRRLLLVFVVANVLSGWMINREYHSEYFLLIAATAALHRLKKAEEQSSTLPVRPAAVAPAAPVSRRRATRTRDPRPEPPPAGTDRETPVPSPPPTRRGKPLWNRFGLVDFLICIGLTAFTFWAWDYILKNI